MNYMERAFAPSEEDTFRRIEFDTWGHLYPKPDSVYWGHIDIACDGGSEYIVVGWELKNSAGDAICTSPVWWEDSNDFACEICHGLLAGLHRFYVRYCRPNEGNSGYEMSETHKRVIADFPKSLGSQYSPGCIQKEN